MRRAALLVAFGLGAAGCAPTYDFADIQGSDSQTRYPAAVEEARHGLTRAAAVALVLFTGWLAVDVARRGRERERQGAAVLTAATIPGVLLVASFVARTSGPLPQGLPYQVAMTTAFWLGPAALVVGATWVVWAFDNQPAERGEAPWGLFLIVFGIVMTLVTLFGAVDLLTGS